MHLSLVKIFIFGCAVIITIVAFQIFRINSSIRQTLVTERARLSEENRVAFEKRVLTPHLSPYVKILQNTNDVRDFTRFRDFYYAATGGGLARFNDDGEIVKHFTVADGLPESDLTALAVYQDKLYIGSRSKDLIVYDGEKFENYVWNGREAQAVTAFLETDGVLLIGTFGGGLIEFDGAGFTEIKAEKTSIAAINCLYKNDAKLYVGTFDNGLWIYENDVWTHLTNADGLPSNRVVGIAWKDGNLYAATDFGLAIQQGKSFHSLAVLPSISSVVLFDDRIFLTKDDGTIFTFDDTIREFAVKENSRRDTRLISDDNQLRLLSNQGVSSVSGAKIKAFSQTENQSLTDNFVSALAFDRRENLWIGTFRRGIDVYSADGKKLKHLESEIVREINFLRASNENMLATARSFIAQASKPTADGRSRN